MVSLRVRFHEHSRRQRLQRRIDLLVASSTHPYGRTAIQRTWIDAFLDGEEMQDVNPIGDSDLIEAIAEAFRGGQKVADSAGYRRGR